MRIKHIAVLFAGAALLAMPMASFARTPKIRDQEKEKQWRSMENGPWEFAPGWYYYFLHTALSFKLKLKT